MRSYRLRRKLAAVEGSDAAWRRMHPIAALVELARSLPDVEPDDGFLVILPRPGTLAADDARWRQLAPRIAFGSLSANIAATLMPGGADAFKAPPPL